MKLVQEIRRNCEKAGCQLWHRSGGGWIRLKTRSLIFFLNKKIKRYHSLTSKFFTSFLVRKTESENVLMVRIGLKL
jgi:hypothetical protein